MYGNLGREWIVICAKETKFCFQNWKVVNNISPTHEEEKKNNPVAFLTFLYKFECLDVTHANECHILKLINIEASNVLCSVVKHT